MTTGKLATALGLHPDTVRKYERVGLIPPAARSPRNGYRYWPEQELETIRRAIFGPDRTVEEAPERNA